MPEVIRLPISRELAAVARRQEMLFRPMHAAPLGFVTMLHPLPRLVTTKEPLFSSWRHLQKQFEGSGQCQ